MALFRVFVLMAVLLFSAAACGGFNVFSVFEQTTPSGGQTNAWDYSSLIASGDAMLNSTPPDYTNAFLFYRQANQISNRERAAILGMTTAYLYMRIPFSDFLNAFMSTNFAAVDINVFADVSAFIATNLSPIALYYGQLELPASNINLNINFSLFHAYHELFAFMDSDNDGNIVNDLDDANTLLSLTPLSYTNYLDRVTNNFVQMSASFGALPGAVNRLLDPHAGIGRSVWALSAVSNALTGPDAQAGLSSTVLSMVVSIQDTMTNSVALITNISGSLRLLLASVGIATADISEATLAVTNLLYQSGVTNYADFTNALFLRGYPAQGDLALKQIYTDLAASPVMGAITDYFGVPSF